ncbi:GSU2403 family nucleotidyltransferase fold protein [Paraburkholderia sp. XV]|uniref:GSU2403 family nucleotidyltransferase fold protein n=1 Tax=Paraburkholderia sp. XV TaxID=2831520 RepID=UPI001CD55371|nr:GSU2403 family nucleotidyltransferase fold protein [Paraburkholderia sp. XV]
MSEMAEFSRLAMTLEPWRKRIVFVGGWAFRLYHYEPRAYTVDHTPIFTNDADVAYAEREPLEGDIKQALEGAGFKEEPNFGGDVDPPAMRYTLDGANGFYAEFLTPLTGSGKKRDGKGGFKNDATELKAGVVAQKLRHLEVLLFQPWLVTIPTDETGLGEPVTDLRVPNPVSFIIQKLLIRDDRRQLKRLANDVVYIHDALQIFYGAMDDLVPIWKQLAGALHPNQQKSVRDGVKELFSEMNDVIREAVTIPTDRKVDPDAMLRLCREGFEELFGEA